MSLRKLKRRLVALQLKGHWFWAPKGTCHPHRNTTWRQARDYR